VFIKIEWKQKTMWKSACGWSNTRRGYIDVLWLGIELEVDKITVVMWKEDYRWAKAKEEHLQDQTQSKKQVL